MANLTSSRRASLRYNAIYYLTAGTALVLVFRPAALLGWAFACILLIGFAVGVHRTAKRWMNSLGMDARPLGTQATPPDLAEIVGELRQAGFNNPLWWVRGDEIGATLVTADGTTQARVVTGQEHHGLLLSTSWNDAGLRTSRGLAFPLHPHEYSQNLADADLAELLDVHNEAVEVLSRQYGPPKQQSEATLAALNDLQDKRKRAFERRRYRQTVRTMANWYTNGYRGRLVRQLGLTTPGWFAWTISVLIWCPVAVAWILYATDPSFNDLPLMLSGTVLVGGLGIASTYALFRRHRFRRPA